MENNLLQTTALLARSPAAFNALLRDLPESWTLRNEGENTWSVYQVIEHLIHCEHSNWIPRAKMILQQGESQAFEPLDRVPPTRHTPPKSLAQLLDEFAHLRSENLRELAALNLQPQDLDRRGRHPAFGSVTLSQLLSTWVIHDVTHLHQISRILAHQHREAVGPWAVYLGVLQCSGHSSAQ
jgi:hypothetical protein